MASLFSRRTEPYQSPAFDPEEQEIYDLLRAALVMRPLTKAMPAGARATWLMAMWLKLDFDFYRANTSGRVGGDPERDG